MNSLAQTASWAGTFINDKGDAAMTIYQGYDLDDLEVQYDIAGTIE
ncbi:MAG: hypothetical protein HOL97_10150, partial [Rhodospirillaceae bacterium]|nr:hypothetical protein [Rhodospirillaceae bacterium]